VVATDATTATDTDDLAQTRVGPAERLSQSAGVAHLNLCRQPFLLSAPFLSSEGETL
jgi:hypothetical protein